MTKAEKKAKAAERKAWGKAKAAELKAKLAKRRLDMIVALAAEKARTPAFPIKSLLVEKEEALIKPVAEYKPAPAFWAWSPIKRKYVSERLAA